MRKLLFSIISVLLCAILLSVNLFAYNNDIEATTNWLDIIASMEFEWYEIDVGTDQKAHQTLPVEIGEYKIISSKYNGEISTLVYNKNTQDMIFYNYNERDILQNTIKEHATEKIIYTQKYIQELTQNKETADEISCSEDNQFYSTARIITQREETCWGMSYYENTSTAYKDRYCKTKNPLFELSEFVNINFFAYIAEPIYDYFQTFTVAIDEMCLKEEEIELKTGMKVPEVILALAKPTLPDITNALLAIGLDSSYAFLHNDLHRLRQDAENAYISIYDIYNSDEFEHT